MKRSFTVIIEFATGDWKTEVRVWCEGEVQLLSVLKDTVYLYMYEPQDFLAEVHKNLCVYFPQEEDFSPQEKGRLQAFLRSPLQRLPIILRSGEVTIRMLWFDGWSTREVE